jgi:L-ribulokinase
MSEHGVPIERVIQAGGIPQKNDALNRVYANVLAKPVMVPERPITSLGSALFAFLAAGVFPSIETAQRALCPSYRVVTPDPAAVRTYERLFPLYRSLYYGLGDPSSDPMSMGGMLPALREIAAQARR